MTVDPRKVNGFRRPLLAKDIRHAQANTKSHAEAARFLGVGYEKYRRYATDYGLYTDEHANRSGKGIAKRKTKGLFGIDEILAGKHPNYDRGKLKDRLINAGYLAKECALCGHNKTRPDGRGPFLLSYNDGNMQNLALENLRLICYNCTYLTTGRIGVNPSDVSETFLDSFRYTLDTNTLSSDDIEAMQEELMINEK